MNESVETFLGLAARYLEWANIVSLQLEVLGINRDATDPTPYTEAYFQAQHERNKARAAMLPVGRKLAAELEAGGHDSTELLTFLHAADAGGGPPAAFPLWPSLKVQLQRILLTTGETKATPETIDELGAEERALALLVKHPEWNQTQMAKAVGVCRQTLYDYERYQKARDVLQTSKADIPHGSKDKDGNMEAWDNDTFHDTGD